MKLTYINNEKVLDDIENIVKYSFVHHSSLLLSYYKKDEDKVSNSTSSLYCSSLKINEDRIRTDLDKKLGSNLKRLFTFKKSFNEEYSSTMGSIKKEFGLSKVFYSMNTNFFLEWLHFPILKDLNELGLTVLINDKEYKATFEKGSNLYSSDNHFKYKVNLNLGDYIPELDKDEISEIQTQIRNFENNFLIIYKQRLTIFIEALNALISGDIPILTKKIALIDEPSKEVLIEVKANFYSNKLTLVCDDYLNIPELDSFLQETYSKNIDMYNDLIKDSNKLSDYSYIYRKLSYSIFRGDYCNEIKNYIYKNGKENFKILDKNPIVKINEKQSDFYFYGELSKETLEKLQSKVSHSSQNNIARKLFCEMEFI